MSVSQTKEAKLNTGEELKGLKSMEKEPGNPLPTTAPRSAEAAEGTQPANATCPLPGLGRGTPLKAAGFKSMWHSEKMASKVGL